MTTSTTTPSTTTSTPAPDAPAAEPGTAGVTINGRTVASTLTRADNQLVLTAGPVSTTVYGETPTGERIALDDSGALQLAIGDLIVVEGSGFDGDAVVEVWMMSTPTALGELTADAGGRVAGRFTPPLTLEPGDHRLVLSGAADDEVRVVLAFGLLYDVDATPIWASWPIWIAVATAVVLALIVPTRYRRRRKTAQSV